MEQLKFIRKTLRARQLAWLRRPELDGPGVEVWEKPNGDLVAQRAGHGEPVIELFQLAH